MKVKLENDPEYFRIEMSSNLFVVIQGQLSQYYES